MNPQVISKLKANLRGRVILPEDQDYNQARKVYNGMIDRHPKTIVKCANAGDVRLAVEFARENELLVAVRGGGHNGAGLGTCDDGMVIDFTQMKGVRFDPSSSTLRAEPGCTQGDVNHLAQSFGVAVPAPQELRRFDPLGANPQLSMFGKMAGLGLPRPLDIRLCRPRSMTCLPRRCRKRGALVLPISLHKLHRIEVTVSGSAEV
jgi:FAD/FMN-containing dehydrogenase